MVSQEILTKQDLKVQQNLSCLNKGDEVEFQEVVIPFFVMKLPYNHVNTIGKPSWVEHTQFVQDSVSLRIVMKEGENKSQTNGQDEKSLKLEGQPNLGTSLLSRKGVLMQMHLHQCFIFVRLGCAEAAAFGVLKQQQTHHTRQLYHPITSYKSYGNKEHLRSSAS